MATASSTVLLTLPGERRERIIVVPDEVWRAEFDARQHGVDWKPLLREYAKFTFIPIYGWFRFGKLVREYSRLLQRLRNQALQVTPIAKSDAPKLRFFPAGHPHEK